MSKGKKKGVNGFAIAGFILSFFGMLSVLGIIFSAIGLHQTTQRKQKGKEFAIAGLVIGIAMFVFMILAAIFSMIFVSQFIQEGIISEPGEVISQEYNLSNFDSIEILGSGDVYLTQGDEYSVVIETGENIFEFLDVEVKGDLLVIEEDWNVFWIDQGINIYVTMPEIDSLSIEGSGDIMNENEIQSENLSISIIGSGDVDLDGKSENTMIYIAGSGDIEMEDFETNEAKIEIIGSGDVKLKVLEKVDINIAGSGDVSIFGSPEVTQEISGSGEVNIFN